MLSNSNVSELQVRAAELYGKGDFEAAIHEYRQVVEAAPRDAQALKGLGLALVRARQVEEGIQACAQAALIQPADAEVRYAYGYALGTAGRYHEATEHFDAVLNLQPNHPGARQALVYSLMSQGRELIAANDAYSAERFFDRAHKIDGRNPETTAALLNALYLSQQKGKVVKLYQALDEGTRQHAAMQHVIALLQGDADYQVALKKASYTSAPASPGKPAAGALQQVPCPNCRQMIMEWAAVCPHCNFRIKAMGTFAAHDRGPDVIWQEVALTIAALVWSGLAGYSLYLSLQIKIEMIKATFVTASGIDLLVGLGLLFRVEWLGYLGKIMCYLRIMICLYNILLASALTKPAQMWLSIGVNTLHLAVAGFLVYLINYSMGE